MMAEGYPARRRDVIAAVVEPHGGRWVRIVQFENAIGYEARVEAVAECIDANCSDDKPQHRRLLATIEGDDRQSVGGERRDAEPRNASSEFHCGLRRWMGSG